MLLHLELKYVQSLFTGGSDCCLQLNNDQLRGNVDVAVLLQTHSIDSAIAQNWSDLDVFWTIYCQINSDFLVKIDVFREGIFWLAGSATSQKSTILKNLLVNRNEQGKSRAYYNKL